MQLSCQGWEINEIDDVVYPGVLSGLYQIYPNRVKVKLPAGPLASFKRKALRAFPVEVLGVLLGKDAGAVLEITEIAFPETSGDQFTVAVDADVMREIYLYAHQEGLEVLGTIHSHSFEQEINKVVDIDTAPSVQDIRCAALDREKVYAIFGIKDLPGRRKKTQLEVFLGAPPVKVQII